MSTDQLTRQEEREFTNWLLKALKERPNDFAMCGTGYIVDSRSKIEVSLASKRVVRVYQPVATENFRWWYRRRIWKATKPWRYRARNNMAAQLRRAMMNDNRNRLPLAG